MEQYTVFFLVTNVYVNFALGVFVLDEFMINICLSYNSDSWPENTTRSFKILKNRVFEGMNSVF
jgi:hypothetical protein